MHFRADNLSPPPPYTPGHSSFVDQGSTQSQTSARPDSGASSPSTATLQTLDVPRVVHGPRYLYYRIYSPPDGPVEVKHPESSEDPFLGCTLVNRITPPHTAANVKQHLSKREAIADGTSTCLFADISCRSPLDNTEFIDTRDPAGPGATSGDPIALVISMPSAPLPPSITPTSNLPQHWGAAPGRARLYTVRTLRDLSTPVVPARDLSFKKDDILYTTGNVRAAGTSAAHIYAKAEDGRMGLVWVRDVEFVGLAPPALLLARGRAGRRFGGRRFWG